MITDDDIRAWLKSKEVEGGYSSIRAALIASTHPFGLFGDYVAPDGKKMYFCNGKLSRI